MIKKILAVTLTACLILDCGLAYAVKSSKKSRKKNNAITAKAIFVLDLNGNKAMINKNPHLKLAPASTAKLMTAILVIENSNLSKTVVISKNAANAQSSKADLGEGESYLTKDLLEAALISSSNDASIALAEDIAGSEEAFSRMMNNRARQLGALNTKFVNSTGLSVKGIAQYSTTYDLVIIMKRVLMYSQLIDIMNKKESVIKSTAGKVIKLKNHNKLLWELNSAVIGKTGYTLQARHCFAGYMVIGKRKFAFAILKSKDPRPDIRNIYSTLMRLIQKG